MSKAFRLWLKWQIAVFVNRLFPKACWADLALWAMEYSESYEFPSLHALIDGAHICNRDLECNEICWCTKRQGRSETSHAPHQSAVDIVRRVYKEARSK